jgi:hypothetical protein
MHPSAKPVTPAQDPDLHAAGALTPSPQRWPNCSAVLAVVKAKPAVAANAASLDHRSARRTMGRRRERRHGMGTGSTSPDPLGNQENRPNPPTRICEEAQFSADYQKLYDEGIQWALKYLGE